MTTTAPEPADLLISNAVVVTMNPNRDVLTDGAVVIDDGVIVGVGNTADLLGRYSPAERIDGSRFVVVPGLVNGHIHASTEPLTRGLLPDDLPFEENVFQWLSPLAAAGTEEDEHLAVQLGAVEMLASGTTTFLEAATGWHVDAAVEGLLETGIRARVGRRIWDRPFEPRKFRQTTEQAIAGLEDMLARHGSHADGRISAWATLVGHTTCSDELWQAAAKLAASHGTGLSFHMSPAAADPAGFLEAYGERPFQHLARLGVLGPAAVATHCVHVDDSEVALLAETASHVVHCPTTALKVAYGVTQIGKIPEMVEQGVNVCLGTDGNNAANYSDLYRATYLAAGLFKDARRD
ncbi:MAG: amidohydrolase family protein, partial [Acidimicrobiaceae bacterium]|nr:amidohydrolase family protein [Acidimicrobiaceae bacterium]